MLQSCFVVNYRNQALLIAATATECIDEAPLTGKGINTENVRVLHVDRARGEFF
jgi:hypothetical protein